MSATTKAERARKIARRLEDNLVDALNLETMLSQSNDDPAVRKAYDQTPAVHGCNIVRHCLIIQLAAVLMRIHDPGAKKRASLPHLFKLLQERKVMEEFRRDARAWYRDIEGLAGSGEQAAVEAISDARAGWEIVKEQGPNQRLRTHRDRYIAHTLIEMSDEENAVCNDAFELLKDTAPIVEKLLLGVLGRPVDFGQIREIKLRDASAFWSRATAGA